MTKTLWHGLANKMPRNFSAGEMELKKKQEIHLYSVRLAESYSLTPAKAASPGISWLHDPLQENCND